MTPKKKGKRKGRATETRRSKKTALPLPTSASETPSRRGRAMAWGMIGLLVAAGVLSFSLARRGVGVPGLVPFPSPAPVVAQAGPEFEDFVGSSTCGECHATKYEAWRSSTHGRAGARGR